jgi:hypothetical protein
MKFFTLMIITITVPDHGELQTVLLYPSRQACGEALPAVYETIRPHYPSSGAQCHVTPQLSASPRPKARPEGFQK